MQREARTLANALCCATVLALGCGREPDAPAQEVSGSAATAEDKLAQEPAPSEDEPAPEKPPAVVEVAAATIATEGHPTLVETLSAARCQRELRCGNVGADKAHITLTACRASVATSWRRELNRYRCDGEIERDGLRTCLEDIQKVECAKSFDTLRPIATCKLGSLCLAQR
ncbi:MAG: DUF6184 family natural product biosynthesis lipoprotein [Polyangiales bacterium]